MATQLRIQQQNSLLSAAYRLGDAIGIILAAGLAERCALVVPREQYLFLIAAAIGVFYLASEFTGMYRNWRSIHVEREVLCAFSTWGLTLLALAIVEAAMDWSPSIPRTVFGVWFITAPLAIAVNRWGFRFAYRLLARQGIGTKGIAIVGVNELGIQLAQNIYDAPELGLTLNGFFDDRPDERNPELPAHLGNKIGDIDMLIEEARAGRVNMIYITFPMRAEDRIKAVLSRLGDSTASVYVVPDFFVFELLHSRWSNIGGLPAVSVFENPLYGVDGVVKRAVDLILATTLLLLLALPMFFIGLMVKLTSRGPVFFRQKRYGLDGRQIMVWKFRSMTVCENGDVIKQAKKEDSRLSPIGGLLRRTSLDELPQLFNVLQGSMSLVGPRPHANAHNEEYRRQIAGYMLRHKVKPGITGLAQVLGFRGETETLDKMERRIECDHRYIREWSIWLDLKILFQTVFVVLSRKNAH